MPHFIRPSIYFPAIHILCIVAHTPQSDACIALAFALHHEKGADACSSLHNAHASNRPCEHPLHNQLPAAVIDPDMSRSVDWDSFNTATPDWEDRVPTTPVVVSEALARALHNRDDFADVTGRAPDLITSSEVDLTPLTAKALESDSLDKGSRASDGILPRTVRFGDISRARRCCVACMHACTQAARQATRWWMCTSSRAYIWRAWQDRVDTGALL